MLRTNKLAKAILLILAIALLLQVICIFNESLAQTAQSNAGKKKTSVFTKVWESFKKHTFAFSVTTVAVITIITSVMTMVKKDKLLKSISGQLITIELVDGSRYRGRLRVEPEGIEVIAEKPSEGNEKVSFILRKDEMDRLHALVRYHDLLTDREKEKRNEEVRKVYHPSIGMRLRRKIRNIINEFRRVITEAFTLAFARVKGQFQQYGGELEETGKGIIGYVTEATYDSLIDRLIGTKVVVRTTSNIEYVGVFKDYTSNFIALLDVNYKSTWSVTLNRGENFSKHERGLIFQRSGDNVIIKSNSPFKITLRSIAWKDDLPDVSIGDSGTTLAVIEPFGQIVYSIVPPPINRVVEPFQNVQISLRYSPSNYGRIIFTFESVRTADIVMLKKYGIIRHRTEKYEPKLLDVSSIKDAFLVSKEEGFILKENPANSIMTIYNGHLTNLPKERMDVREVDDQISQRWAIESYFQMLDRKLRPIPKMKFIGSIPSRSTKRLLGLFVLMSQLHSKENWQRDPLLYLLYSAICYAGVKKKAKIYKRQALLNRTKTRFIEPFKKVGQGLTKIKFPKRQVEPTEEKKAA